MGLYWQSNTIFKYIKAESQLNSILLILQNTVPFTYTSVFHQRSNKRQCGQQPSLNDLKRHQNIILGPFHEANLFTVNNIFPNVQQQ